jgi:ABC-type multidrug transport system ATPase subunit
VIEVAGLTKRFGSTLAVDDLSFSVKPGRITGFLGPNGAGKSTTMRVVLGLVKPTAGTTSVLGVQYRDLRHPVRRVGVLLETFDAHPGRSGRNHLRVLALAGGISRSRVPCSATRRFSFSTSRRMGSTRRGFAGFATFFVRWRAKGGRSSSRAMCSPRWLRPWTTW